MGTNYGDDPTPNTSFITLIKPPAIKIMDNPITVYKTIFFAVLTLSGFPPPVTKINPAIINISGATARASAVIKPIIALTNSSKVHAFRGFGIHITPPGGHPPHCALTGKPARNINANTNHIKINLVMVFILLLTNNRPFYIIAYLSIK